MTIENGDLFMWKVGHYQEGLFIITGSKKIEDNPLPCSTYRFIETGEDDWHFDSFIIHNAEKLG